MFEGIWEGASMVSSKAKFGWVGVRLFGLGAWVWTRSLSMD